MLYEFVKATNGSAYLSVCEAKGHAQTAFPPATMLATQPKCLSQATKLEYLLI